MDIGTNEPSSSPPAYRSDIAGSFCSTSSPSSDSYYSLEDSSEDEDLDADVIQLLRQYGVRFIRDLRAYRECACTVPSLVTKQFRESSDPVTKHLKNTSDPVAVCLQRMPSREDFDQDPYGDLFLQDFFVGRDERGSTFGVLHFAGLFANIEYDSALHEYRMLNLAGKPSVSITYRSDKHAFKLALVAFIQKHSPPAVATQNRCPEIHPCARLLVLSYPRVEQPREADSPAEKDRATASTGLIDYVISCRENNQPVAFPSHLHYMPNWLVHTIDEQFEHYQRNVELRSVVTSVSQLRNMSDSEIPAEDDSGQQTAPSVIPYQAVLKTRLTTTPELICPFQRLGSLASTSSGDHRRLR